MVTVELTGEQLQLVRIALAAYAEQLALEQREYTYSAIVIQRLTMAREVQEKLSRIST